MGENVWTMIYIGAGALFGVAARVGKWWKPDGSLNKQQAISEIMSAPAIAVVAGGICRYIDPNMDPIIVSLVAVCFGIVGIAAIEVLILKVLNRKADGV